MHDEQIRKRTLDRFHECEEVRSNALALGKTKHEAHLAARQVWNDWAVDCLQKRKKLIEEGFYSVEIDPSKEYTWISAESIPCNTATAEWLQEARTDFYGFDFKKRPNFKGFVFPGQAFFGESKKYHVHERTSFEAQKIRPSVTFKEGASFDNAVFHLDAVFDWAKFDQAVGYTGAVFKCIARFDQCIFEGTAWFHKAHFFGDAWLGQVKFLGYTDFFKADFRGRTSFYGVRSDGAFILNAVNFNHVPDFTQSSFQGIPRLDNASIRRGKWYGPVRNADRKIDRDASAKFRELKRLAIQGEDHRSELRFHAHEIRTARFVNDWPHQPRFWFGIGYELLANFGRSILRPAVAWGALVTLFAAIYLGISAEMNGHAPDYASLAPIARAQPCLSAPAISHENVRPAQAHIFESTSASAEAWSLALKNGFVFIDWDRAEAARRTYGCLFGLTSDGSNTYPVVPRWVSIWGLVQNVLSAVLIFLLLLGIRNLLKLK